MGPAFAQLNCAHACRRLLGRDTMEKQVAAVLSAAAGLPEAAPSGGVAATPNGGGPAEPEAEPVDSKEQGTKMSGDSSGEAVSLAGWLNKK